MFQSNKIHQEMETILSLFVKLPTYDIIQVNVAMSEYSRVHDIKLKICSQINTFHFDKMILTYQNTELSSETYLKTLNIPNNSQIDLFLKLLPSMETFIENHDELKYDNFIVYTEPISHGLNVSIHIEPTIIFHSNRNNLHINIDSLKNCYQYPSMSEGDMVKALGNRNNAIKKGFHQWTNNIYENRIFLILIDNFINFKDKYERTRYFFNGVNGGYSQGDQHSWQRYTNQLPIACGIEVNKSITYSEVSEFLNFHDVNTDSLSLDDDYESITLIPYECLKRHSSYGILLSNNVPIIPCGCDYNWTNIAVKSIQEDVIIVFQTGS